MKDSKELDLSGVPNPDIDWLKRKPDARVTNNETLVRRGNKWFRYDRNALGAAISPPPEAGGAYQGPPCPPAAPFISDIPLSRRARARRYRANGDELPDSSRQDSAVQSSEGIFSDTALELGDPLFCFLNCNHG